MDTLTAENRAQHEALEERLLDFYERLTALDLEEAKGLLEGIIEALRRHMEVEEAEVIPRLEALLRERQGDTTVQQIEGDHTILRRTFARSQAALAQLFEVKEGKRRAMVRALDTFLLLGRVLEHHTAREERQVFPLLDEALADEERDAVLARMKAARPR